jgi:RNA polymerase sigma-70 factor (ECF subfamily)
MSSALIFLYDVPMPSEQSDEKLLRLASAGDETAARRIYDRHASRLLRFLTLTLGDSHAAEDILQGAFLYLFRRAKDFDPEKASLPTYLHLIARNLARNELRRRARKPAQSIETLSETLAAQRADASLEDMIAVMEKLSELSDDDREILLLRYVQGMKPREIAGVLEISAKAVSTRVYRAIQRLQEIL